MIRKVIILTMLLLPLATIAQVKGEDAGKTSSDVADAPVVPQTVKTSMVAYDGDSIPYMEMGNVYVYPKTTFKNKRQARAYSRLVRNVKRVLPIAKEVNALIIETYEFIETLPTQKAREEHLKLVEKNVLEVYKPRMKRLTFSQGKLLIKLIHRECNSSSYEIVKAFLGPIKAGFYQAFASVFGASLRKKYEPDGDDKMTEQVILMVESGQL